MGSHAFLGPISHIKVGDGREITADLPSRAALSLELGDRLAVRFDPQSPRLLSLMGDAAPKTSMQPQPAPPG